MAEPLPFVARNCEVEIDGVSLKCLTNHLEVSPDVSQETATTFCGVQNFAGATQWQLILTLYTSFDDGGSFELLLRIARAGEPVPFVIIPNADAPVSATNPEISGEVIPQAFPIISADAGTLSTIDITWSIVGEPNVSPPDTPTRAVSGTTSTTPATVAA